MAEYDKNNNPIYVINSPVKQDKKWRKKISKEFYDKYGAWWVFAGVPMKCNGKQAWIEQFRKSYRK